MSKRAVLYIVLALVFAALTVGGILLLIQMGCDVKEILRPRPIGPILPPPIIQPKFL